MDLDARAEAVVARLGDDAVNRFGADPSAALIADFGLIVRSVDHLTDSRGAGGECDGLSYLEDGVILYAPTPNSKRENFTLAHEFGHFLVEKDIALFDWIADQVAAGMILEQVCNRIAQRLLLDDARVKSVVGTGQLRAIHVLELFEATRASRPVCAIALAGRLRGLGAVAILERADGSVTHSTVQPDVEQGWPEVFPWRGQSVSGDHPLTKLNEGGSLTQRLSWRSPWGTSADFYVDAIADARRVYAVFSEIDLWKVDKFHGSKKRDYDQRLHLSGTCCGQAFSVRGYPCDTCKQPYCPRCGDCRCGRDAKRSLTCRGCQYVFLSHLLIDGRCEECRG